MPKNENLIAAKFKMVNANLKMHTLFKNTSYINILDQEPLLNTPYFYQDKKYGRPIFRLKKRGGEVSVESDAFWFTKDEKTEAIKLNCILEVCREEADVHPLLIKNTSINFEYQVNGSWIIVPLKITQTPFLNQVNILENIHAEAEFKKEETKVLREAISNLGSSKLTIQSEMWWQMQPTDNPEPLLNLSKLQVDTVANLHTVKAVKMNTIVDRGMAFKPQFANIHAIKHNWVSEIPIEKIPVEPPKVNHEPQKIDLNHTILLCYEKDHPSVFGNIIDNITAIDSKWKHKAILKDGANHTIYYRGTAQPDMFSFLPQVYRIRVNEQTGEPKIMITMVSGADPNKIEDYRIRVNIQLMPYYHPKAKKDLFDTLSDLTEGEIKYCDVVLDNYNSASYVMNEIEISDLVALNANIPLKIDNINPVNGFSISLDCTLESFDVLKRKLKDGFDIGNVIFELVEETDAGEAIISSQPIPVELDLRKLAGIPVGVTIMETPVDDEDGIPEGIHLFNENIFPIKAKGVELTLLSMINDTVYEVDLDLGNTRNDWPITLIQNKQATSEILLNKLDIDALKGENRFWTELICEPFGIEVDELPETILERVIDYATGDPQIWELQIECLLFQRWDELDENLLQPYNSIQKVAIEIKQNEEATPLGAILSKQTPSSVVQMARSISQILKSQKLGDRNYLYRIKTYYVFEEKPWSEWKNPESTAANYLSIYPQKLQE
jgi:hypothetical protein